MTSHARPCYNLLSEYTQNGIKTIVAPTPVETVPEIGKLFTFHKFSEIDYKEQKKMFNTSVDNNQYKNTNKGYYKFGALPESIGFNTYQSPVVLGTSRFY